MTTTALAKISAPPLDMLAADTPLPKGEARDRAEVKRVSEEFESLFLNLVMKSMRETVQKSGLVDGGNAEGIYTGLLDAEYTKQMASQRSTGIADSVEEFLLRSLEGQDEKAMETFQKKVQEAAGRRAYGQDAALQAGAKREMMGVLPPDRVPDLAPPGLSRKHQQD